MSFELFKVKPRTNLVPKLVVGGPFCPSDAPTSAVVKEASPALDCRMGISCTAGGWQDATGTVLAEGVHLSVPTKPDLPVMWDSVGVLWLSDLKQQFSVCTVQLLELVSPHFLEGWH